MSDLIIFSNILKALRGSGDIIPKTDLTERLSLAASD